MIILIHWLFKSLFLIHRHAGGQVDASEVDVDLLLLLLVIQARVLGVLGEYVSAARPPVVSCALFTCHMYPRFSKRHLGLGICVMRGPGAPRLRTPGDIPGCPRGRTVHVPGVDAGRGVASRPAAPRSGIYSFQLGSCICASQYRFTSLQIMPRMLVHPLSLDSTHLSS